MKSIATIATTITIAPIIAYSMSEDIENGFGLEVCSGCAEPEGEAAGEVLGVCEEEGVGDEIAEASYGMFWIRIE